MYLKRITLIIISLLTLSELSAWADELQLPSQENHKIYEVYRKACGGQRTIFLTDLAIPGKVHVPADVSLSSLRESSLQFRFFSASSELTQVLESPGYQKAIEECFPNDPISQEHYTLALRQRDFLGKFSSAVGMIYSSQWIGHTLSKMGQVGTWTGRVMLGLMSVQATQSAIHTYVEIDHKLHPSKASREQALAILKAQIEVTNHDIEYLEEALKQDPENQDYKELLSHAQRLHAEMIGKLKKLENLIVDPAPDYNQTPPLYGF